MALRFNEDAEEWLEGKGFSEGDMEKLLSILATIRRRAEQKAGSLIILPKDTPDNVAAMAYLLEAVTDENGRMLFLGKDGIVEIPDEARESYREGMELQEMEHEAEALRKTRMARGRMDPRKRSSVVKG